MSKQLTAKQLQYVARTAEVEVAKTVLALIESGITSAQWHMADVELTRVIKQCYARGGVTLIIKASQRTRPGWSKLTFDGENELEVRRAQKSLERARKGIEKNGGYVVEAAKEDIVAKLIKAELRIRAQVKKLTDKQRAKFRAGLSQ